MKRRPEVTVADLKDQMGTPHPRPMLWCPKCGNEESANAGDYWQLPKDYRLICDRCKVSLRLVQKTITLCDVFTDAELGSV